METNALTFDQLPEAVGVLVSEVGSLKVMLQQLPQGPAANFDEPMDLGEAAAFIKLAPKTVSAMAASGELPYSKPAKKLLFFRSELLEWVRASRKKTTKEIAQDVENHLTAAA